MATVTGLTAARMLAIEANCIVNGAVDLSGNLKLTTHGGTEIDAGHVSGTRWGLTNVWAYGTPPNAEVNFYDGGPPRVGDLLVSTHPWAPGSLLAVSAVIDSTHADLVALSTSIRGPEGTPGEDGADSVALSAWPVGSIFMAVVPTNPATLLGGGTWETWGTGRIPVGLDDLDPNFNTVEETGGSKTHTHDLGDAGWAQIVIGNNVIAMRRISVSPAYNETHRNTAATGTPLTGQASAAPLAGATNAGSTLPPYIVCYMWKRTA